MTEVLMDCANSKRRTTDDAAVVDLLGGQVQGLFAGVPALIKEKSDRVRPVAIAESQRSRLMPDLPTIAESGLPGFAVQSDPRSPPPRHRKRRQEVAAAVASGEAVIHIRSARFAGLLPARA